MLRMLRFHVLVFIFFSVAFCAFSSTQNYKIQHYTTDDGLAQNYVASIFKDSRGFMWFGTWYGLNRFDGYNFVSYRENAKANSISDDFINNIVEDKNGDLWIATRQGINKFDFDAEKFSHFKLDAENPEMSISDNWITTLLFDDDDNLWIGTETQGVNCISFNNDLTQIDTIRKIPIGLHNPKGTSHGSIYSMLLGSDGYIYIGSTLGLDRLDPKSGDIYKFQNTSNPLHFKTTIVHCLFEDNDATLWCGTEDGLVRIDNDTKNIKLYEVDKFRKIGFSNKTLHHGLVMSIGQDNNGTLLIGTMGGLHLMDKEQELFELMPVNQEKEESLNNMFINEVFCDSSGNVWIGTAKGGVNKYNTNQKEFNYFSVDAKNSNDVSNAVINSLYEDERYLWIGSAGKGLFRWDKSLKKIDEYKHQPDNENSISSNFITTILPDANDGQMWFGTWGRGLNLARKLGGEKLSFKTHLYDPPIPYGEPNIYVSCSLIDKQGYMWIGTPDGIYLYDAAVKQFYPVNAPSSYGDKIANIGAMYLDVEDNLWVGTTKGLNRIKIKPEQNAIQRAQPDTVFSYFANENDTASLSGNFIVTIYQDVTKQLWFSVFGKGLSKLDTLSTDGIEAKFSHYQIKDGLSNGVVYGILEDDNHNLWLSTDKGITSYNYKTNTSIRYYESDGLHSDQFYWSAALKGLDGTFYFGSSKGLIHFKPENIKRNTNEPKVVVTNFKLFNKAVSVSSSGKGIISKTISQANEIHLRHDENIISFEFAALSYFTPQNNQYQYRLVGFDKEWVSCSADRRFATYTNLNPGEYSFEVKGSNNDGLWSKEPTRLKLVIRKPWWQTDLFMFSLFILVSWLIWLVVVLRNQQLRRKKAMLEHMVRLRTKALKEKSEALELQTSQLNESNDKLSKSNETKDKLFAIIAHDLKSPFNVILSASELLHENYNQLDETTIKRMLQTVYKSTNNFYMLLENLLEWTRVQGDSITVNFRPVNLKEVIENNILVFEDRAAEKEVCFKCKFDSLANVRADENMLNTVFRNLISNAIKFTSKGDVTISVSDLDKNNVLVQIQDSGMGMDIDQLEKLFIVKEAASTRGTHGEKGTGLGLLVCKEFVEISGGRIWAKSQKGKGTSFYFTIPVK